MNHNGPIQIVWKREDGDVILHAEFINFLGAWKVRLWKDRKYPEELSIAELDIALRCIAVSARATKTMEEIGHL